MSDVETKPREDVAAAPSRCWRNRYWSEGVIHYVDVPPTGPGEWLGYRKFPSFDSAQQYGLEWTRSYLVRAIAREPFANGEPRRPVVYLGPVPEEDA